MGFAEMMKWTKNDVWRLIFVLFLGQLVSINLALTSFSISLVSNLGVGIPLTQSFFTYLSLALVYTPILLSRCEKLQVSWYWYALLGFIDVQGNYLVVKSYEFTSITSATLLDCWTIPWVLILTWIFIGTRYSLWQFFGAALCILGLCLILLSDSGVAGSGGKKPLLGDLFVIGGTLFYAMSNVGEEFCVKKRDRVEVVAMLGVFGVIASMCEISIFEREDLKAVKWSTELIIYMAVYALSTFIFYSLVPFVLKMSGAALFNLSLLTSDMWAVLIRIFFYHQAVDWLYYLSFVVVAVGLVIYSLTDNDPTLTSTDTSNGDDSIQYQVLDEEDGISRNEFVGVAVCVVGLCLVLLSDSGVGGSGGKNPLIGDLLVIGGTLFYAMSNVGEISILAVAALSSFIFYSLVPVVLKVHAMHCTEQMSGAALFNLSLLTSDMWAVLIRIFFYHQKVEWLYYVSFAVVAVGLVIYSLTAEDPALPSRDISHGDHSIQYQVLDEEEEISRNEVMAT